jgi:hypothetical protein
MSCETTSRERRRPTSVPARGTALAALIPALLPVLLTGLALGACGKKGPPLPPLRAIPAAITDLSLRQQGSLLFLEMGYPATTTAGMALGGVDTVELWVLTKPLAAGGEAPSAEPQEFQAGARPFMTLRGSELQSAIVGNRIQVRLPVTVPDQPVADIYAVRTTKAEEISAYSNRVALVAAPPPPSPTDLALEATAEGVTVSWQYDGEAEGFRVFRRLATERGYGDAVREVAGGERQTLDRGARFGQRYIYMVRTVGQKEPLLLSEPAGEREIDFQDRFAPRLPENLVALPERGAVRLRWEPSPDNDVAGYKVYRRDPTRRDFAPLVDRPLDALEYVDRGLSAGLRFEYRLQVVDRHGNESPLSDPVAVTPR